MPVLVAARHFVPASLWPEETPNETPHGLGWLVTERTVTGLGRKKIITFLCDGETDVAELLLDAFLETLHASSRRRGDATRPDDRLIDDGLSLLFSHRHGVSEWLRVVQHGHRARLRPCTSCLGRSADPALAPGAGAAQRLSRQ